MCCPGSSHSLPEHRCSLHGLTVVYTQCGPGGQITDVVYTHAHTDHVGGTVPPEYTSFMGNK